METCSMLCGSLGGKGVWGRMDTCICMIKFPHCSPETITALSISCTLTQDKKLKKKKKKCSKNVDTFIHLWASLVAQAVKNPPAMQKTPV